MNSVAYDSDDNYRNLKLLLQDEFGVVVGEDQEQQVTDKLDTVMAENDIDSLQSLTERLHGNNSSNLRTEVLHAITERNINWFGYPEIMAVFSDYILPNIKKDAAEPYRVWVVGCGNGQTAFSLAIAADKYRKKEEQDLAIEIIATDSADETVRDAAKAKFKASFLFGLSDADKSKYMTLEADEWVVNDSIKSMVSFSTANPLYIDENDLDKVDLIICPDILVYYTVLAKTQVLEFFATLLNGSGMLMTGIYEPIIPFCKQFAMVEHDAGIFYRKQK